MRNQSKHLQAGWRIFKWYNREAQYNTVSNQVFWFMVPSIKLMKMTWACVLKLLVGF